MARIKQTARRSTHGRAPRKALAGSTPYKPPPPPEHNYVEEARQLLGWRQRATEVQPSSVSVDPGNCVFDVWRSALGSSKVLMLFCGPDICVHLSGRIYRLEKQDFDGFVALSRAAIAECAKIGNLSRGSSITCQPHSILRMVQGTYTSPAGGVYPEFATAKYTSFEPCPPRRIMAQATNDAESSDQDDQLPVLHALYALLSVAYMGYSAEFNEEAQGGPISEVMRMYEGAVFGRIAERLEQEEEAADDFATQEEVDSQIKSEVQQHSEATSHA